MYFETLHTHIGLKCVLKWHRVLTEKVSQKYTELIYSFMVALLKWPICIANDV